MPIDVSTPLPQLDLAEGTTITVTLDDPSAIITSLAIHGWQAEPSAPLQTPDILLAVQPEPTP